MLKTAWTEETPGDRRRARRPPPRTASFVRQVLRPFVRICIASTSPAPAASRCEHLSPIPFSLPCCTRPAHTRRAQARSSSSSARCRRRSVQKLNFSFSSRFSARVFTSKNQTSRSNHKPAHSPVASSPARVAEVTGSSPGDPFFVYFPHTRGRARLSAPVVATSASTRPRGVSRGTWGHL